MVGCDVGGFQFVWEEEDGIGGAGGAGVGGCGVPMGGGRGGGGGEEGESSVVMKPSQYLLDSQGKFKY